MPNPATATLRDLIEGEEATLEMLEIQLTELADTPDDTPTIATLRRAQDAYRTLIQTLKDLAK